MNRTILVVAAHPDDELLGVGGTVARHVSMGDDVYCHILGQGALSREGATSQEVLQLKKQAREAGAIIGFTDIFFSEFPDNAFDSVSLLDIVKAVEQIIERIKPAVIYTHHAHDVNIDHQLTCQAVLTASRPCNLFAPQEIYSFETLSATEWQQKSAEKIFKPTVYINIEETIEKKRAALRVYASELRPYPHSRSEEGVNILAQFRGLEAGLHYAESFELIRSIEK